MFKSLSITKRHEMKQSINSLFGLTRSSALPMPWKSHYVHGTSDVIGKNATANYSLHCSLGKWRWFHPFRLSDCCCPVRPQYNQR